MDLGVSKHIYVLAVFFVCTSFQNNTVFSDSQQHQIAALELQIKENERLRNSSISQQRNLEYEITSARRIIQLLKGKEDFAEEEVSILLEEIKITKEAIAKSKERCKDALVKDYIYKQRKGDLLLRVIQESSGVSDFLRKVKYVNLVSKLRLRQIQRLKAKQAELNALHIIYAGTDLQKLQLNEERTNVIVDVYDTLRQLYADNELVGRKSDSLALELLAQQPQQNTANANSKGFTFPVMTGLVVRPYGKYQHPTERKIQLNNNGVDILTFEKANALSAADSKVQSVLKNPNGSTTIICTKGEFLLVYGGLGVVDLQQGDRLRGGQAIGPVMASKEGRPLLHFEIWKDGVSVDPQQYIYEE